LTRWDAVRRWRDALRDEDPPPAGLSPEGAREAWESAWDLLDDAAIDAVAARPGRPYRSAAFVAASTVPGAPIEWLAALLGHGTEVLLKVPHDDPGWSELLAQAARDVGLPLAVTTDRAAIRSHPLVVAMGRDETLAEIGASLPDDARFLSHGTKFSVAWVTGAPLEADPRLPRGFGDTWGRVAADAALYDGRGCLSPAIVLTNQPMHDASEALLRALDRAAVWPAGPISATEGAAIRHRAALAKALGVALASTGGSVHALPAERAVPASLPRSMLLCHVPDAAAAAAAVRRWGAFLSTVGTDEPASAAVFQRAGASRVCPLGRMQRPEVVRIHDGRDWTQDILQPTPPAGA
jgi:hypothetical protein